jgi:hypothetical protein
MMQQLKKTCKKYQINGISRPKLALSRAGNTNNFVFCPGYVQVFGYSII